MSFSLTSSLNCYLVGGAVRDKLLNHTIYDKDWVVVGSTTEEMLSLGFNQVGKDFPVFLHPETKEEYALARTERKNGTGYTGFICNAQSSVTLEEDLLRRDITINAMAETEQGEIVDPYHGQKDIKNRVLRHVSEAFIEDPLRVLRVARFAARFHQDGFTVAPETLSLMAKISENNELASLSKERIWQETAKSLETKSPHIYLDTLNNCEALIKLWPEFNSLVVENKMDSTVSSLKSATQLSSQISVRFAAICHQLSTENAKTFCESLKVSTKIKTLTLKVNTYSSMTHHILSQSDEEILELFDKTDVWRNPEGFDDYLIACQATDNKGLNYTKENYPPAIFLNSCLQEANKLQAKTFIQQGFKGAEIKAAFKKSRLAIINNVKENFIS